MADAMSTPPTPRRETWIVATRASRLALAQTRSVADALQAAHPHVRIELLTLRTRGDRLAHAPLADAGGKGLFCRELEAALLEGRADLGVHSAKDVPAAPPEGLHLLAFPPRADPWDVLISRDAAPLADLPAGARVGTGSPRRRAQLLRLRADLQVVPIRGNVETRLAAIRRGGCDAVVLAAAGLQRLGLADAGGHLLGPPDFLPAAGQGALAVQAADATLWRPRLAAVDDPQTAVAVRAERKVVAELGADCHSAVGVLARVSRGRLTLTARVLSADGDRVAEADAAGPADRWVPLARSVVEQLRRRGAERLLT
jgi:hydroxymethylbilane synthase